MAHFASLFNGSFCPADEVLLLLALDPEVWWIIGQVRENGDHGRAIFKALIERAIEIRYHRNQQIGPRLSPKLLQQLHLCAMVDTDDLVHSPGELRRAERPTFFETEVINVFQPDRGELPKNVEWIEKFLEIDETNFPRPLLLFDDCFERVGGGAMATARVEVNKVDFLQDAAIFARATLWR
jgi:hypothetical protein